MNIACIEGVDSGVMVAYLGVILFDVRLSRRVHHVRDGVLALLGAKVSKNTPL